MKASLIVLGIAGLSVGYICVKLDYVATKRCFVSNSEQATSLQYKIGLLFGVPQRVAMIEKYKSKSRD